MTFKLSPKRSGCRAPSPRHATHDPGGGEEPDAVRGSAGGDRLADGAPDHVALARIGLAQMIGAGGVNYAHIMVGEE